MKSMYLFILGLFLTASLTAQTGELLGPDDMQKQLNYYLGNVKKALEPNENGEVELYVYTNKNGEYARQEVWVKPEKVYKLIVADYENDATQFPMEVFLFPNLQDLYLNMWQFTEVPASMSKNLPNLQSLDLSNTAISSLPSSFGDFKHLEFLIIAGSKMTDPAKTKIKALLPKTTVQ